MKLRSTGLALALLTSLAQAQETAIYPFAPMPTEVLKEKISRLAENENPLTNIFEMQRRNLEDKNTKTQPWGGSFWPLNQGMIGNNYRNKNYFKPQQYLSWKVNVSNFKDRKEKVLAHIDGLKQSQLDDLAPSEKYDLLLGDKSFDLTNRVWNYAETWGEMKKWGFLSSIDLPPGYRVPEGNTLMAMWEGICHGWAVASGHYPRPEKTVNIKLPNGKNLPFYPNDIKALVSILFAHSTMQDNVIMEGLRCNKKFPEKDEFGRYIDEPDENNPNAALLPRCADVHPAVMHISFVNIAGIEGRSFIVDHNPKATIANQPLSGYSYKYFNPRTGKFGTLQESIIKKAQYEKDPFKSARNSLANSIVGVTMDLRYVDWEMPRYSPTNSPEDDKITTQTFNYDLELDKDGNIVGGQWRTYRNGRSIIFGTEDTDQPDFFWVIPRDYMKYFKPLNLESWDMKKMGVAPESWKQAAMGAHAFTYNVTREFGFDEKCKVIPEQDGLPVIEVPCEFKYPKPQPLINVVNQLLDLSRN
jgi:hypothetical protein